MSNWAEQDSAARDGALSQASRANVIGRALLLIRGNAVGEADVLLGRALSANPDDPAFLHLFGIVRDLQERGDEAETFYRRSLAIHAAQPHVHRDLGRLLVRVNRIGEGIAELNEAIRLDPANTQSRLALAASFARHGDHVHARDQYREIVDLESDNVAAKLGLAEMLCRLDHAQGAERVLRDAMASASRADSRTAARISYGLGRALQLQKKFEHALAQFDAAQRLAADFPAVDFARAETLQQMGRWEDAAQYFRKVLQRNPDHANAAASLALICALLGDFAEARQWSAKPLALDPPHPIASIACALCEIEDGKIESAAARVRSVLEEPAYAGEQGAAFAAGFVAAAFDRHGCYGAAFAASAASKNLLRNLWRPQPRPITERTENLAARLASMEPWSAPEAPKRDDEPRTHVFVLGFPRTGTTLLEAVLATERNVVHAHEVDFLAGAEREFLATGDGLQRLATANENTIASWRARCWKAVQDAKFQVAGTVFVDKMPVNTFRLPLIARLFPSAKILFTIRDPRDVVLSCFRHHFDPTPYSYEFLRLADCARLYTAAMQFAEISRRKLPLRILDFRYEDFVADFDGAMRKVCEFTGIGWTAGLRNFVEAARTIDLSSASARQVRRGLYTGSVGHWRNYRQQLAPVLPLLAPWVARFGYPAD